MPNVILQPVADKAARKNYHATVESTVALSVIQPHVSQSVIEELTISGNGEGVCVWGVRSIHEKGWGRIHERDVVLFSRQNTFFSEATVITKTNSAELANQLWGKSNDFEKWPLLYFISRPIKRDIPYETFNKLVGYADNFIPQGFMVLKTLRSKMYLSSVHESADKALEEPGPLDTVTEPELKVPSVMMRSADIRRVLYSHMPVGVWMKIDTLYDIVKRSGELGHEDYQPSAPGGKEPKWRRNVRNILQRDKDYPSTWSVYSDRLLDWNPDSSEYRLYSVGEPELTHYDEYTREGVHDIFSPGTPFHAGAGTWGLLGIVPVPSGSIKDFVFFVTFGQRQAGHVFDEMITGDGILTWQSQPAQTLQSPMIKQLIQHEELRSTNYLFLRTQEQVPYTYFGRLTYLEHDPDKEKPVYFKWQIEDWDLSQQTLQQAISRIGLQVASGGSETRTESWNQTSVTVTASSDARWSGELSRDFSNLKAANTPDSDARDKSLDIAGQKSVMEAEKKALISAGRNDLAETVSHKTVVEGDTAGYDVRSYTSSGDVKYIKVITTRSGINTPFDITSDEVAFSRNHAETFYLYRLCDFGTGSAVVYFLRGDVSEILNLDPKIYRATISSLDLWTESIEIGSPTPNATGQTGSSTRYVRKRLD